MRRSANLSLNPTITGQLQQLGVSLVYLYGSEAVGRANRLSDIDVGIVLRDPTILRQRERRAELRSALHECLASTLAPDDTRELDVVLLQTASPVLQFQAINAGHPLFAIDPIERVNYEAAVIRDYLDVRPLVEAHYQAALDRIA